MKVKERQPHPVDIHVGARVRLRRTLLGMSQGKLAEAIGLTFQQVQKYEKGASRVASSRLYGLSRVLDVPVGFFFEDMPASVAAGSRAHARGKGAARSTSEVDLIAKRETIKLVRAYYKITSPHVRKRLFELTKALAAENQSAKEKPRRSGA